MTAPDPWPLEAGDADTAFASASRGTPFKHVLEALLLALPDDRADRLMQMLREARGAWFPLLASRGGSLLFVGNALSGAITPLANAGFVVTALDPSHERLRLARLRDREHSPGRVRHVQGGDARRLPFADTSFDVVVAEEGNALAPSIGECRRVARGELVVVVDNRLAYKRSSGKRNDFSIPNPLEWAVDALTPRRGERTLGGYRRWLARDGFERPRAFALYPHARDFTHVVGLDAAEPSLTVGPQERRNKLKLAARSLGLFPVLTPSFALVTARARTVGALPRIDHALAEIAERVGEPRPRLEQLVGTRGNTIVLHTRVEGADASDPRGRWTLHVPLCPKNVPQLELHMRSLALVRERFPRVPVPEPLFHGRVDGVWTSCERRLPGWTAPQFSGDRARVARMLGDVARHFAELVVRPASPLSAEDFEEQVGARFALVIAHAAVPSTIARLERLRDELRERLVGEPLARVLYHADLRGKHVQIDDEGRVLGYLDWGTTEPEGLPYFDLLHLVVHERKQELRCSAQRAWELVRDRIELRDDENAALDGYARAVGLRAEGQRAIAELYPVLVAAMAEKNWDYSRPRWLHRQFGI